MLVAFLIMLREGLEAALIVGIIASYLRHAGKGEWMPLVWIGAACAALICLGTGLALDILSAEVPQRQQELFEALVGVIAVGMLTAMAFWMRRAGRSIKSQLQGQVAEALGTGSGAALILMVFLAVAREGLEAVFFLLALFQQSEDAAVPLGALLGLLAAVAVGMGIAWGGLRLNLSGFFRWTGLFILLVAAGLAAGSLRALHEAGVWNGLQQVAFDFSRTLPMDGMPGAVLAGMLGYVDRPSIGELGIWLLFILVTMPLFLSRPRGARA